MDLPHPTATQPEYGRHLGDATYWGRYVTDVLDRHSLPLVPVEAPFVGTFPTFLAGDLVVKMFGPAFDGESSNRVEAAMHTLLATSTIPAPAVVASGCLFSASPHWPYLVTERVRGRAVRELALSDDAAHRVAASLGLIVHELHQLPSPVEVADRDELDELRREAPERLRRFGLPDHLVEQVPEFLADAEPADVLVHGDITADHVFVDNDELVAVIDWGDALVADRSYELPAVYLDALRGDRDQLTTFLDEACWPVTDHPRRGLQGILEFQFNAITAIAARIDLSSITTLEQLAGHLFDDR